MAYVKCSKCKRTYNSCSVQKCPHEAVNSKVGQNICMYCCRKCKHNVYDLNGQICQLRQQAKATAVETHIENGKEKDTFTPT